VDYIRETMYGSLEVELDETLTKGDQNGFEPRPCPKRREQPPQVAADDLSRETTMRPDEFLSQNEQLPRPLRVLMRLGLFDDIDHRPPTPRLRRQTGRAIGRQTPSEPPIEHWPGRGASGHSSFTPERGPLNDSLAA
jgi:hypothetical protein